MLLKKNGTYYRPHLNSVSFSGQGLRDRRPFQYLPSSEYKQRFKSDYNSASMSLAPTNKPIVVQNSHHIAQRQSKLRLDKLFIPEKISAFPIRITRRNLYLSRNVLMLMTEAGKCFEPIRRKSNVNSTAKSLFLEASKKSSKRTSESKRYSNFKLNTKEIENAYISQCANFENYKKHIRSKTNRKNVSITLPSIDLKANNSFLC